MTRPRRARAISTDAGETAKSDRLSPRFRLGRARRVVTTAEFSQLMKSGRRITDARLQIWYGPTNRPVARLGLVIGRRHGTAVVRNRLKRLAREAFRLEQLQLPAGFDWILSPRPGVEHSLASLRAALLDLVRRARLSPPQPL